LDYHLITSQSIVKARILSKNEIQNANLKHNSKIITNKPNKIYLEVLIEDIIKGDNLIKNGDKIVVRYNSHYKNNEKWEIGDSYLFNLSIWMIDEKPVRFIEQTGDNDGYFLVKDNVVHDKTDFFKQGTQVDWQTFKTNLKSKISNIVY